MMEKWNGDDFENGDYGVGSDKNEDGTPKGDEYDHKDEHCTQNATNVSPNRPTDPITPLIDILSSGTKTTPNSDIIFIFDRAIRNTEDKLETFMADLKDLQKKMYQKRLRVSFSQLRVDVDVK